MLASENAASGSGCVSMNKACTPEATAAVCHKLLPGFGEEMRRASVAKTPHAILSRQNAGIRNESLILNLPGNPKAIDECLDVVIEAVAHCVNLISDSDLRVK